MVDVQNDAENVIQKSIYVTGIILTESKAVASAVSVEKEKSEEKKVKKLFWLN
ncbi:hypothetical protein [Bacillus rhizoplanae]|uniref:hypothetical protein n=1 Tax=Bacillus rhizoplanae TaxID=2880966 RepID=UPI003D261C78